MSQFNAVVLGCLGIVCIIGGILCGIATVALVISGDVHLWFPLGAVACALIVRALGGIGEKLTSETVAEKGR